MKTLSSNVGDWYYDEPDPTAKAYEDNYWDERVQLMERAIEQAVATRDEERAYVIEDLLGA